MGSRFILARADAMAHTALKPAGLHPPRAAAGHPRDGLTVVHVAAEYWPLAQVGGLAEAVSGLAAAQHRAGLRVMVVLPLYRGTRRPGLALAYQGVLPGSLSLEGEEARWWRWAPPGGPEVWLMDHPCFDRDGIYGEGDHAYPDNGARYALLSRGAVQVVEQVVSGGPVVLHAHDWHGALAMVYLRLAQRQDPMLHRVAGVLSVHNAAYQGQFPAALARAAGLPAEGEIWERMVVEGEANWLRAGLEHADAVVTVSPTHARELITPVGGFGLWRTFAALGDRLRGIRNGIDQVRWNPARDPSIPARYSAADLSGKRLCKLALQRELGLAVGERIPLVAMSARLVWQKGLDLVLDGLLEAFGAAQFAFLGRGESRYEAALAGWAARFPDRVVVERGFDDVREHRLLAGADLLLMPSYYEPCGLTQMRAQRYGVLPVARRVGGLADTIAPDTGFLFEAPTREALARTLERALAIYARERDWRARVRRAMGRDFGWSAPVREYGDLYRCTLAGIGVRPQEPLPGVGRRPGAGSPRRPVTRRQVRLEETRAARFT